MRCLVAVWLALVVVTPGCGPGGIGITEYQQGYRAGIDGVREMRVNGSSWQNFGMSLAVGLGQYPKYPEKSVDWNSGYRQGIQDEMSK